MGLFGRGDGYFGFPVRYNPIIRFIIIIIIFGLLTGYFTLRGALLMAGISLGCLILFSGMNFSLRD